MSETLEPSTPGPFRCIDLMGMSVASLRADELLDLMANALESSQGGWLVTANLDILRRYCTDSGARIVYEAADIRVADGMPLIWASKLAGTPLPERVAGASLVEPLVERCEKLERSVFLLGGAPGSAEKAAHVLCQRYPRAKIGADSKLVTSAVPSAADVKEALARLGGKPWDVVLVGLGSPKQEFLIEKLREHLRKSWLVGVGISFGFLSGDQPRAPLLLQKSGLEWLHRMVNEPRRLSRRYLVDDLPFFLRLIQNSLFKRLKAISKD